MHTYICLYVHVFTDVNAVLRVDESNITENSARLICELPCSSPDLRCKIFNFTACDMNIYVTNATHCVNGLMMLYVHKNLSNLNSGTTYNYCVIAINTTNMTEVGKPVCSSFTTDITPTDKRKYITHL